MYTRRNIRWAIIFKFGWWRLIVFLVWSAFVTALFIYFEEHGYNCSMPLAPLGTIGVAVAFYVGFKNNQSYDRFWEARKIWGGIVNVSRAWGNQVLTYVSGSNSSDEVDSKLVYENQKDLIHRHLAWITSLRYQLRRKTPWGFEPKGLPKRLVQPTDIEAMKVQVTEFVGEESLDDL